MHPVSLKVYIPDIPKPRRKKTELLKILIIKVCISEVPYCNSIAGGSADQAREVCR